MRAWLAQVAAVEQAEAQLDPGCRLLGADPGDGVRLACAVLAGLPLTLIALGFGPLRGWLEPADRLRRGRHLRDRRLGALAVLEGVDGGLVSTWRLYRAPRRELPAVAPPAPSGDGSVHAAGEQVRGGARPAAGCGVASAQEPDGAAGRSVLVRGLDATAAGPPPALGVTVACGS